MTPAIIDACAEAAHEINRVYCAARGQYVEPAWDIAAPEHRASLRNGVRGALAGNTPEQSHTSWTTEKIAAGWTFGAVKAPEVKTHPCLVPYAELPTAQRAKDTLFLATVRAMAAALS
jgi:hypothetical protein